MNDVTATRQTSESRGRRRSRPAEQARTRRTHGWLRSLYFSLAALWGYSVGVGVLLFALRETGAELTLGGGALALIVPGALVALVGAWLSAAAYRQSRRRIG